MHWSGGVRLRALIAVCLMVLISACGPDGAPPAPRLTVPAEDRPEPSEAALPPSDGETADRTDGSDHFKIALLLPLTGPERSVGRSLLSAATLAMYDAYDPALLLLPMDTGGTPEGARAAAQAAVEAGSQVILGPVFAENALASGEVAAAAGLPQIAFSNDARAARPGLYIMGFQVGDEISRVVNFARDAGITRFAALSPFGRYGDQVQDRFADAVFDARADLVAFERFPRDADLFVEPVKTLADYDARREAYRAEVAHLESLDDDLADDLLRQLANTEVLGDPGFEAILIAEGGAQLRALAPLLPFYEIDPDQIQFLGTGLWNDQALLSEPPLQGAWFAAPDPTKPNAFLARLRDRFDLDPPRIATLAYDAVALAASFKRDTSSRRAPSAMADWLLRPEGFNGLDGPLRFLADGRSERALAILEVTRRGFRVLEPAPPGFPSFGYGVRAEAAGGSATN